MLIDSAASGTVICRVFCVHTGMCHMTLQARNHHFCCLDLIVIRLQKQHSCHPPKFNMLKYDYREELMSSLSSARQLACESIRKAQQRYERYYDRKITTAR